MASDERLVEGVREWLERGGYILEMRVARLLRRHGLLVDQGYAYTDPTSGREREGDISAMVHVDFVDDEHWHMLDLIVECKSTTAPWVGFQCEKWGNGPWSAATYMDQDCALCEAMLMEFGELRRSSPSVYALTEKRHNGVKDHAYEAMQQAANATLSKYAGSRWDGHPNVDIITVLGVPVVVTTSPLILCELDDDSGQVSLTEVERMNVIVARLGVPEADSDGMEILVVREQELPALVSELKTLADNWRDDLPSE